MKRNTTVITMLIAATILLAACTPTSVVAAQAPAEVATTPTAAIVAEAPLPVTLPATAAPTVSAAPSDYQATETLSASEIEALILALQDEYKALATYEQVMADFGSARPFSNIARAEEQHIAALSELFVAYGLDIPANEWLGQMPSFDSVTASCEAGVAAEVDNAALYDQLFSMVDNADIIAVFERSAGRLAGQAPARL